MLYYTEIVTTKADSGQDAKQYKVYWHMIKSKPFYSNWRFNPPWQASDRLCASFRTSGK